MLNPTEQALELARLQNQKDKGEEKTYQVQKQEEGHQPQARYQGPPKAILKDSWTKFKEKESPNLQRQKSFKNRGTKCKPLGDVFKEAKSHSRNKCEN